MELDVGGPQTIANLVEDLVDLGGLGGQQTALGLTHGFDLPPEFIEF